MDTSRLATKNQLLLVAALTSASIFATLFNIRTLSDRVESIDQCQRELARGFVRIDSTSRGLCCPPPVVNRAKLEADALQRRAAENAVRGAIKSIEAAGYTLDDLPEHPAAPWPDKAEVESIDAEAD